MDYKDGAEDKTIEHLVDMSGTLFTEKLTFVRVRSKIKKKRSSNPICLFEMNAFEMNSFFFFSVLLVLRIDENISYFFARIFKR